MAQQLGPGQAQPVRSFIRLCLVSGRGPSAWTLFCECFPRHTGRELDPECSSLATNWHLYGMPAPQVATTLAHGP